MKLQAKQESNGSGGTKVQPNRIVFYADAELLGKIDGRALAERRSRSNMIFHILTRYFEGKENDGSTNGG